MQLTINILIILCLAFIVVQDLKHRAISWVLIPLTLAGFIYKGMAYENVLIKEILLNIAFIAIQLVLLTLYMSIKNKKWVNIVNTYLGIGDVLFFLVLCAAFSPLNFITFYLLSLVFTLTGIVVYNCIAKKQTKDIPLAGVMAAAMIVLMLVPGLDFYNDGYLLAAVRGLI